MVLELVGTNPGTAVSAEQCSDLNEINRAVCIYHVGQCCVSIVLLWSLQQSIASGVPFFLSLTLAVLNSNHHNGKHLVSGLDVLCQG